MSEKNKILKNTNIYIDNDLTSQQLLVANKLRIFARENKDKQIKIGGQRALIENSWLYTWDVTNDKIIPITTKPKPSNSPYSHVTNIAKTSKQVPAIRTNQLGRASGGILLIKRKSIHCKILNHSKNWILVLITCFTFKLLCGFVYFRPHEDLWVDLANLYSNLESTYTEFNALPF
ncbi:Protein of unknown function [Cotesia congregata]|uniref:Uncharacterized protein n=1 Tax=Cotesia congregata TaxID=51543 RepID=A0A8J2HII0_COTCN|nr:Protein of unknown function [Cotesia congregata]